jgi:N-acetylneuraminate synthase
VGEIIDEASVRSMRPAGGLAPVHFAEVVGRRVLKKLDVGAPITWDVLEEVIDSSIQFGGFKP